MSVCQNIKAVAEVRGISIKELSRRAVEKATAPTDGPADPHCSDETLTLPDLVGWDN